MWILDLVGACHFTMAENSVEVNLGIEEMRAQVGCPLPNNRQLILLPLVVR